MTHRQLTWLVTGASAGLGRAIAEAALTAGDRVLAAVRTPERVADLAARHPDHLAVVAHDVRDVAHAPDVVRTAIDRFDSLDVVVNNAGRGLIGAAEEVTDAELRELMDLHLFGPVALVRAALPHLRARRSGTVIQVSSQGGRLSFPGVSTYSATKFALEGWSEALAGEVAGFGVRVLIVEPSAFRTSFNADGVLDFVAESPVYQDMLAPVRAGMRAAHGRQEGDPARAAEILVGLAHAAEVPLRLALGQEALDRIGDSYRRGLVELERWADVAASADFADTEPASRPS